MPSVQVDDPELVSVVHLTPNKIVVRALKSGVARATIDVAGPESEPVEITINRDVTKLKKAFSDQFPTKKVRLIGRVNEIEMVGAESDELLRKKWSTS